MLRVGIIAEGKSEWLVLEAIMRQLQPDIEFVRIRPDFTLASMSPFGWKGVRAWCQEFGGKLEAFMRGVKGREIDLLVIHADCSMAHNEQADRPCPPASDTADALRKIVVSGWLKLATHPHFVLVTNPSKSTDAWVVAALEPPYRKLEVIECDEAVDNELVARGLLRMKNGKPQKSEPRYRPLAELVAQRLDTVQAHCLEAKRFVDEFKAFSTEFLLSPTP